MALQMRGKQSRRTQVLQIALVVAGIVLLHPALCVAQSSDAAAHSRDESAAQPHKLPAECADIGFPGNNLWLDYYEFDGVYPDGWPKDFTLPADSLLSRHSRISRFTLERGPVMLQTDGFTAMPWDELVEWVDSYFDPRFWCRSLHYSAAAESGFSYSLPSDLADSIQLSFDYRPIYDCVVTQIDHMHITLERSQCTDCSYRYFFISIELNSCEDTSPAS
jgi:hypothetical protein